MNSVLLRNFQFTYAGAQKPTLDIPVLDVFSGEKIFLFGPSGSGKSTLLELLSGVLMGGLGQLEILGQDVLKMNSQQRDLFRRDNMGYIFQNFNLIPYLDIAENILLPLSLGNKKISNQELQRLTSSLGIDHLTQSRVTDLSVGQQQRVALARALIAQPKLILADEPTSALDYEHRERFLQLLFAECDRNGTTLIFVSHDLSLQKLFSRVISFQEINRVKK